MPITTFEAIPSSFPRTESNLRDIIAHKDRILAVHVRELLAIRDLLGAATDESALDAVKRRLAAQVKA